MMLRITPRRALPAPLAPASLKPEQRAAVHMIASLLLDYPDDAWYERLVVLRHEVRSLPDRVREPLDTFLTYAEGADAAALRRDYVKTFDLKRKCALYLTYYAAGDTRRRGAALVTFIEAYRAAGWEFDAAELPDYIPAVLEFSAMSGSRIAGDLLAAHREGIEVLRHALESQQSPWADVVRAVTLSLPPIDERTRERYLQLINEGPPAETVGLSFPGGLPPFAAQSTPGLQEVR